MHLEALVELMTNAPGRVAAASGAARLGAPERGCEGHQVRHLEGET
jgi:hypothetical protein